MLFCNITSTDFTNKLHENDVRYKSTEFLCGLNVNEFLHINFNLKKIEKIIRKKIGGLIEKESMIHVSVGLIEPEKDWGLKCWHNFYMRYSRNMAVCIKLMLFQDYVSKCTRRFNQGEGMYL